MGRKLIDLTGQRFGRLTVIERVEKNNNVVVWNCRCTCGNTREVRAGNLKSGGVKSCGCLLKDIYKKEKYIFKKRGIYIVSITRNKINMLSNGQKDINDAIKLRDFYLKVFEENPEKWKDLCYNKKYKNIEILKESL